MDEKIYHPQKDVEAYVAQIYKQTHHFDEKIQKAILDKFPNTYTFTKNLAEQMLIATRPADMQLTIIRPTIVGSAFRDPFPGWVLLESYLDRQFSRWSSRYLLRRDRISPSLQGQPETHLRSSPRRFRMRSNFSCRSLRS